MCPAIDADSSPQDAVVILGESVGIVTRRHVPQRTARRRRPQAPGTRCNDEAHARFARPVCQSFASFERDRCESRGAALGLHLPSRSMVALHGGATTIDGEAWVRCTQADPLGCNWLVPEARIRRRAAAAWLTH